MENRLTIWEQKWQAKTTGWHMSNVNRFLFNHFDKIESKSMPARVLVPLCGKTLDMKWFYDLGHHVVGIEGCDIPIIEFFKEQGLSYNKEVLGDTECFTTEDGRLKIYKCDLFSVNTDLLGKFDCIWDRGSLVAIYSKDRTQYANLMKQLFAPNCSYLVATMVYDQSKYGGPPHSVPPAEIQTLFGDECQMRILETVDSNADSTSTNSPKLRWNLEVCHEVLVLLKFQSN